mgnify:FL=1
MLENKQENMQEPIYEPKNSEAYKVIGIVFAILFIIVFAMLTAIAFYNSNSDKIISGIYIKNVNVSGLTKQEAIAKVNNELEKYMDDSLVLVHNEYRTEISLEQLEANFDVESAVNAAYSVGKTKNIFKDGVKILDTMFSNINIDPVLNINENVLRERISGITAELPDTIIQSSYYIDGNNLVITKGKKGYVVSESKMFNICRNEIQKLSFIGKEINIEVEEQQPQEIDLSKIHEELYKEPVNAYYTTDPYTVHPSEDGVDFKISMEEAENLLQQDQEEYIIPLKVTVPEITTKMIGTEAFPDLISEFSTKYSQSQRDRTTNLKLAAEKINGTVLMPGEVFSYNTVVGKRTIDAGYKEAKIYVNGEVVDGLGGGICQVSSTLYNAVLYANLEIVERRNHQFVPSYAGAGLDATVVYGSIDFQFKNTRNYPIKIQCSVDRGICNFQIYGLKEETEYEVNVWANVISRSKTAIKSKAYRQLKLNGEVVSTQLLSSDTYKVH